MMCSHESAVNYVGVPANPQEDWQIWTKYGYACPTSFASISDLPNIVTHQYGLPHVHLRFSKK
jgi:hypothetical protein